MKSMMKIKIITIVFSMVFLLLSFVIDDESNKPNIYWKTEMSGQVRLEKLFVDNDLIEINYYSRAKLDSFRIFDGQNMTSVFKEVETSTEIDSVFNFFVKHSSNQDSIRISFWLPIESKRIYHYNFYRDSQLLYAKESISSPVLDLNFGYPSKTDSKEVVYEIEKITLMNSKITGKVRKKFMVIKDGKVDYHRLTP